MLQARPLRPLLVVAALAAACDDSNTTPTDSGAPADRPRPDAAPADVMEQPDAPAPDAPAPSSGIGSACESEEMFGQGTCAAGQICLGQRLGFRNGYCIAVCNGAARCPADSFCTQLQGFPVCMRRCMTNTDCRTDDGYVCLPGITGPTRICRVNDEPVGRRPDGAACFTTNGANRIPALARRVFSAANVSVSSARNDSFVEAEGNVAVHPMTGAIASSYIAAGGNGAVFMGVSYATSSAAPIWDGYANVLDPLGSASDPVLEWGRDGSLRMTFIGLARTAAGGVTRSTIRITESTDNGRTWSTPRQVEPMGFCPTNGGICDKPWLITGPAMTGTTDAFYLGYLRQTSMLADVVVQRSDDGARTWGTPVTLGRAGVVGTVATVPNLVQFAVGGPGVVAATWIGLSAGMAAGQDGAVRFGSPDNRVYFRRTTDGFNTTDSLRIVSRLEHSPVYTQAPVALDGNTVHVAFVNGDSTGAWDLILATSPDNGATWQYRKVNDEPERCATHMLPAMVVDRTTHDVHLVWLDNRFGDGGVAYARCPANPATRCGANEAVSDRTFRLTTGRNPMTWHGDYLGLTITAGGDLHATWSDTRSGVPAMYVARGRAR